MKSFEEYHKELERRRKAGFMARAQPAEEMLEYFSSRAEKRRCDDDFVQWLLLDESKRSRDQKPDTGNRNSYQKGNNNMSTADVLFYMRGVRDDLDKLLDQYRNEYAAAVENSFKKQLVNLQPGQAAPEKGLATGEDRDAFRDLAAWIQSKYNSILDEAVKMWEAAVSEVPSEEAVRFLDQFALKKEMAKDEVDAVIRAHGDTFIGYERIADIAAEHDIRIEPHKLRAVKDWIDSQRATASRISLIGAEKGAASPGSIAFSKLFRDDSALEG